MDDTDTRSKFEMLAEERRMEAIKAAAPDLLEALRGMMVFYGMDRDRQNGACEVTWKKAETAIGKAKGTP